MKKLLLPTILTAGLLSLSATAQESVHSVNIVGFQKVDLQPSSGMQILAVPFSREHNTLLDVFGTNSLRQSDFLAGCDRIILYDNELQTYQRWAQWTDGKFYRADNLTTWNAGIEGNPEIPVGTGFWVISASTPDTNTLVFAGDVVGGETQGLPLNEGLQLIGYMYSSEFDLTDTTDLVASGASSSDFLGGSDKITLYDPTDGSYTRYALWTDGIWYKANSLTEWNTGIPATAVIPPGQGFWYQAINTYTWNEPSPYPEIFD